MLKLFKLFKEEFARRLPWAPVTESQPKSTQPAPAPTISTNINNESSTTAKPPPRPFLSDIKNAPKLSNKASTEKALNKSPPVITESTTTLAASLPKAANAIKSPSPILIRPVITNLLIEIQNASKSKEKTTLLAAEPKIAPPTITTSTPPAAAESPLIDDELQLTEPEQQELAKQIAWLKKSFSIEDIRTQLKLYEHKSTILADELEQNPDLLTETIAKTKSNDLVIEYLKQFLDLIIIVHKKHVPNEELDSMIVRFDQELRNFYFDDPKNSPFILLNLEANLHKMDPDDPKYEKKTLLSKKMKHRIIGKKYALDMLYSKIKDCSQRYLISPGINSLKEEREPIYPYLVSLSLSLTHFRYSKLLSKIIKHNQKLLEINQAIADNSHNSVRSHLILSFNAKLSELFLDCINASFCSALLKSSKFNQSGSTTLRLCDNLKALEAVLSQYTSIHQKYISEPTTDDIVKNATRGLQVPIDLIEALNNALELNNEQLECSKEFTRYINAKQPPAIPARTAMRPKV